MIDQPALTLQSIRACNQELAQITRPIPVRCWVGSSNTRGKRLSRSSATGTRPSPSSSFLHHDLQERMGEFQLVRTGDQSPRNNIT